MAFRWLPAAGPTCGGGGFANPYFYNYDPVCFDCNLGATEPRLVQLDHEAILCNSRIQVVREIAPSFIERDGSVTLRRM